MAYQIKNTRGQVISTVSDYGTDNSTSIELVGRGVSNYGLIEQSNLLHILENFANPVAPTNPIEGQLWFNTSSSNQVLSVYYNGSWNNILTIVSSSTPPTNVIGLWLNTTNNTLFFASNGKWVGSSSFYVSVTPPTAVLKTGLTWLMIPEYILWMYDETIASPVPSFRRVGGTNNGVYLSGSWRMIGTQYPINAGMKSYYASVPDTSSNFHDVIVNEIDNKIVSVESYDNFTMLSSSLNALPNFSSLDTSLNVTKTNPKIYSGITLNQSVTSNVFGGLSLGVLNFDITDVIGRGENLSLRPTTPISDSTIDLGSSTVKWRNFYSNNVYASSNIQIGGNDVATQAWVDSTYATISNLNSEIYRAKAAEATKENLLGFTPVQQGTGISQQSNTIKLGYDGTALRLTVDNTDFGEIATENWVSAKNYASETELQQKTTPGYITNNVEIDPDSNNLLRKTNNGLLVELAAAPDVSNQYVSSSTGSDTTGDGSQSKPFKTIRRALNRVPDHTQVWIHLNSSDTFDFTDGANGYVENGTLQQVVHGNFYVGSRNITFLPYNNTIYDSLPSGVADDSPNIGTQPLIRFTYSKTSDTAEYTCAGFALGSGTLYFHQISFTVKSDNLPSTSTTADWVAPFTINYGTVITYGCNFNLSNGIVFGADGGNESSGSVVLGATNYYNTTNGTALMDARCGYTLRAPFGDITGGNNIIINGRDTGLKQKAGNFNASVANSNSFLYLNVINSSARIYAGLTTQNKLDN